MTDRERLEIEVTATDRVLEYLEEILADYRKRQGQLTMDLNRACRLEREELQRGKQQS